MALKRKTKRNPNFSLISMTDIIFLLLIFFMITSTIVVPNAIKVTLPQAQNQTVTKPLSRVTIDDKLNYYVAFGNQRERQVSFDDITPFLQARLEEDPDMFVAIYADEKISYGEIVRVLNVLNINNFKPILVSRPPETKQ